jgi:hypothetical protein
MQPHISDSIKRHKQLLKKAVLLNPISEIDFKIIQDLVDIAAMFGLNLSETFENYKLHPDKEIAQTLDIVKKQVASTIANQTEPTLPQTQAAKEMDKFFSFCDKDSTILHVRFIHSFCKEKRSAMDCIIINKGDESKLPLANTVLMYSDFQDRDDDFDSLYNRLR